MGWMPRGISWLRTIVLSVILTATALSLRFFSTYGEYFTYASRNIGFFISMSLIGLFVPFIGYAYIHCWLVGKKPEGWAKNIPSPASIKESLLSFIVLIFGSIATILIIFPFAPAYVSPNNSGIFGSIVIFVWVIVTLYMFHAYHLISRSLSPQTDKPKSELPNKKVNCVDRDLINLKNKTGIHFKEPPKQ